MFKRLNISDEEGKEVLYVEAELFYKQYVQVTLTASVLRGEEHYENVREELLYCFIHDDGFLNLDASQQFLEEVYPMLKIPYEHAYAQFIDHAKSLNDRRVLPFPKFMPRKEPKSKLTLVK